MSSEKRKHTLEGSSTFQETILTHLNDPENPLLLAEVTRMRQLSAANEQEFQDTKKIWDLAASTGRLGELDEVESISKLKAKLVSNVHTKRRRIYTWLGVAAAVLAVLTLSILLWPDAQSKKTGLPTAGVKKDIAPGGNRAVLKLANGTEIVLDGHATGLLASEGHTKISKTKDGMLIYDAGGQTTTTAEVAAEPSINTLITPSGGQYMLILPDRSKVWLNAESSISYPSAFTGAERNVTVVGEAYFEVTKDKQHPFTVKAGAAEVRVLGTHFNIMSYASEGQTQISLAEGSVRVDLGNDSRILSPGQQALIKTGTNRIILRDVDIDEAIDWKNGLFQFDNTPIDQVMRQIRRWYNVDVVYQGVKPNIYFTGMVSRSNNVSKILELIEEAGGVNFEIGDKQIIVKTSKRR